MKNIQRAFTLIELLVVIAIIAILAAILFPVFAQAKKAAKTTVAISNMKQIGTSVMMYVTDFDDVFMLRRVAGVGSTGLPGELSWKQVLYPYTKNTGIFADSVNIAAKYPDDTSDPAYRASIGSNVIGPITARGYAFFDAPWLFAKNWSASTLNTTAVDQPANTILIAEQKLVWVDTGPWISWDKTQFDPAVGTVGALGYPWGGSKWDDKAQVIAFQDGHTKRATNGAICGRDDQVNMWGYQRNQLSNYGGLGDVTWVDTFCSSMPASQR